MIKHFKKYLPDSVIDLLYKILQAKNGNYFYLLWIFPIKKKKIVVCNYFGRGYGDNAKYIIDELMKQRKELNIVWLVKKELINEVQLPSNIQIVTYGSLRSLYELATAKIWIDNSRKIHYPPKRKKQYYIQTWHSPLRLKKIERDAEASLGRFYIDVAKRDSKNCDLILSGCDFSWNIFKSSFWYDGEVMKSGTPRCDIFFQDNSNEKTKVCDYFNVSNETKLVLYAPTFRRNNNTNVYKLEFNEILHSLKEKFGGEWKFLVRLHPNVTQFSNFLQYDDNILNATEYDDMQELLHSINVLITDFSSSMFDMAIAEKTCFIHAEDINEYLKNERELYFNIEDLPFDFSMNTTEIINNITRFDSKLYEYKIRKFLSKINSYEDGQASKRVVNRIIEVAEEN